jgi:hypothetical protein
VAAANGNLPEGFKEWGIRDASGQTVAHVAAANGKLPDNFEEWDLVDNMGVTVREEVELFESYKKRLNNYHEGIRG